MKLERMSALVFVVAAGCGLPAAGDPVDTLGMALINNANYNFGTLVRPGACLDVNGAGTADGTKIQEWWCNGTPAQRFRAQSIDGTYYRLVNPNSGKCLDVSGNGTLDGTPIQLWTCNDTSAQAFRFESFAGYNRIIGQNSGKCLDVSGANPADGTQIQLWTCNGTDAQTWNATEIGGGSGGGGSGDYLQSFSTWYCGDSCGMNDTGSCGLTYCEISVDPSVLGAALSIIRMNGPSGVWKGGGLCGKHVEIVAQATGRSITVPVIDACQACNADDHVDLTLAVWEQLGVNTCDGKFTQKWRFVD